MNEQIKEKSLRKTEKLMKSTRPPSLPPSLPLSSFILNTYRFCHKGVEAWKEGGRE